MKNRRKFRNAGRGSGLVLALIAIAVASVIGLGIHALAKGLARQSVYAMRQAQAQALAESGVEDALLQLALNPFWRDGFTSKPAASGSYTVTLTTGTPTTIVAKGYAASLPMFGSAAVTARCQATLLRNRVTGRGGLRANTWTVNGLIDAYDSSVNVNPLLFGNGANLWSNGTLVTQAGAMRINGDAYYFLGSAPASITVAGTIYHTTSTVALPFHDGSAYQNSNDNSLIPGNLYNPSGKEISVPASQSGTLPPGTYYFNKLSVQGTLNLDTSTGTVTIYLAGPMNLAAPGAINNLSKIPSRVLIYVQGNQSVSLAGVAPLHAYVEAPAASVDLGGILYGNLVANVVTVETGAWLHFDTQFAEVGRAVWQSTSWSVTIGG